MVAVTGIMVVLSSLAAIGLFVKFYKYIKLCNLNIWGVALCIDLLFPAMGGLMATILDLPINPILSLFSELVELFTFGIILSIYSNRKILNNTVIWVVFIFFCILWLIEFTSSLNAKGIVNFENFYYAPIFSSIAIVAGVMIYWVSILKSNQLFYRKDPFFWLSLGWFILFLLTSTSFIPIIKKSDYIIKWMLGDISVAGTLANICYIIAFVKTKNWVIKGYSSKS